MSVTRWGALGFMGSGVAWVAAGIVDSFVLNPGFAVVALATGALFLLVLGLVGLHALQGASYGLIGRAGFLTFVVGALAQVLGLAVFVVGSSTALLLLVSPVGPLLTVVGWVLYGVATLQAGVLPRWSGVLFIVSLPVALILDLYRDMFFGLSGDMFLGLVLLILSSVLWPLGGTRTS